MRNLVSETPFPAGENIAWWDGSDDLLRDPEAARHGVYHIPTRPVAPGTYKVRGLWHQRLKLHYEFSIYNAGKPAWTTADNTGCWLTTHTPPTSMAVVPGYAHHRRQAADLHGRFCRRGWPWFAMAARRRHEDWRTALGRRPLDRRADARRRSRQRRGDRSSLLRRLHLGRRTAVTAKTRSLADQPIFKQQLGDDPRKRTRSTDPAGRVRWRR